MLTHSRSINSQKLMNIVTIWNIAVVKWTVCVRFILFVLEIIRRSENDNTLGGLTWQKVDITEHGHSQLWSVPWCLYHTVKFLTIIWFPYEIREATSSLRSGLSISWKTSKLRRMRKIREATSSLRSGLSISWKTSKLRRMRKIGDKWDKSECK